MVLAWHTAALVRQQKRMSPLKKLLIRDRAQSQSWEEQLEIAKRWAIALGGTVSKREH